MRLTVGSRFGPYEILSLLGAGGMGEVYRARDTRLGRAVALKILLVQFSSERQYLQRFEQEARAASALNHPNIVTIYETGQVGDAFYIVMEFVDGKTLREVLTSGPLPIRKLLQIAAQVADGLAKAHEGGIVHRDLKPENVMITREGLVKLLDFGLAKMTQRSIGGPEANDPTILQVATEPGMILGSVGYMSPQQVQGQSINFQSDQFSFGAILYEMATGKRAFKRETSVETMSAIIREEPESMALLNPKVPPPLRWIVDRCLAKDPEDRYASTRDLARDLQALREHVAELDISESAIFPLVKPQVSRRRFWIATAGIAIVLLAIMATLFFLDLLPGRSNEGPQPTLRQLTFRHGYISRARLGADGQSVIYTATWIGEAPNLYSTRPGSPESGSLGLRNAGIFSISPSGEMAVALGCRLNWGECMGTLAQVPAAGGAPREILKDVHEADWSPDGKSLAVVQLTGAVDRLQYPIGKVLYESPGWITDARVSPSRDLVAFLEHPILGEISGSVCIVDQTAKKTTLSSGWKGLQGLAWSASGNEIWFTGSRISKTGSLSIHAVSLSGKERVVFRSLGTLRLCDISRDGQKVLLIRGTRRGGIIFSSEDLKNRDLSWFDYSTVADLSPDGKTLLFSEWGEGVGGAFTVYLRKTDGSDAVRLGDGKALALSPDGNWAAAVQQTTPPQLVLLPTGPGQSKILSRGSIQEYYDWAAWSPDGTRIFFAAKEAAHQKRTYLQYVEGGQPQAVTPEGMVGILLSPDLKFLAAIDRYGEYYLCPVEGGEPQPIEGYLPGDVLIQWSADGRSLFLRGDGNLVLRIYKLDLSSGRRELWKELTSPDPAAVFDIGSDPGTLRLTPDGRFCAYTYWTFPSELYLAEGLPQTR